MKQEAQKPVASIVSPTSVVNRALYVAGALGGLGLATAAMAQDLPHYTYFNETTGTYIVVEQFGPYDPDVPNWVIREVNPATNEQIGGGSVSPTDAMKVKSQCDQDSNCVDITNATNYPDPFHPDDSLTDPMVGGLC